MAAGSSGLAVLLPFDLMADWHCQLQHSPVPSCVILWHLLFWGCSWLPAYDACLGAHGGNSHILLPYVGGK